MRFEHILFVCQREREPDNPKGSCKHRGSAELLDRLKSLTKEHKLKGRVRVTAAGCLDFCAKGCTVVAYTRGTDQGPPRETWYTHATPADAEELFESHVLKGTVLERLQERSTKPRGT